jgi:hypothetical protein
VRCGDRYGTAGAFVEGVAGAAGGVSFFEQPDANVIRPNTRLRIRVFIHCNIWGEV